MQSAGKILKFATEVLDRHQTARLGTVRRILAEERPARLRFDFSATEWADPLSLLILVALVATYRSDATEITVDLGSEDLSSDRHRIFLKFISNQGFIDLFSSLGTISWHCKAGRQFTGKDDVRALKEMLSLYPKNTHFQNADCILAKLVPMAALSEDPPKLVAACIERLIAEAQARAINTAFGADPYVRDRAFVKLRKILFELLFNVVDHAYENPNRGYAGIYVRVRGGRPLSGQMAQEWDDLRRLEHARAPGLKQFDPALHEDWIEVFLCDVGCGLLNHLDRWTAGQESEDLHTLLTHARRSVHRLWAIAPALFRRPLSRLTRHDADRTAVTGLQFLGHMLGIDGDYSRLYSEGQWIGGSHPWAERRIGDQDLVQEDGQLPAPGTAYIFAIQPKHTQPAFPEEHWQLADDPVRRAIIHALRSETSPPSDTDQGTFFIDHRDVSHCSVPAVGSEVDSILSRRNHPVLILRPPHGMNKRDLGDWITAISGPASSIRTWRIRTFILADLTPFQALILANAVAQFRVSNKIGLQIFFVTQHWYVRCLTLEKGSNRFADDLPLARRFLAVPQPTGMVAVTHLASHLRVADSRAFWRDSPEYPLREVFMPVEVEWPGARAGHLEGYLDLASALASRSRYRACRRSLHRLMELYPKLEPIATDDLLSSLVTAASRRRFARDQSGISQKLLAVGSICVTASTIRRFLDRPDLLVHDETVSLFVHHSASVSNSERPLPALHWMPPLSLSIGRGNSGYSRISGTPFVAQGGERAISIIRFKPRSTGTRAFEVSYYGRTPNEMYSDFEKARILKLGHWSYGSRHDLMTINVRQAIEYSVLEGGGHLMTWLHGQLQRLFTTSDLRLSLPAVLMIYPSYSTTDQCMALILSNPEVSSILPNTSVVPVKFIGEHTVSPLFISPLVKERVKSLVRRSGRDSPAAVIFDASAITGKHLQELRQLLVDCGCGTIHTVVILDRTGLPVAEGVMENFRSRHARYWRWDVPRLGHSGECLLCSALDRAMALDDRSLLASYSRRLREWRAMWRVRPVPAAWHEGGVSAVQFGTEIKMTFGLDVGENGETLRNRVPHRNSTSLAAMVAELTRLTTKAGVGLSKARKLAGIESDNESVPVSNEAAMEIIASQLLLFRDEMNFWEKHERFQLLLRLMWDCWPETSITALAGLCFTLVDDSLITDTWKKCKSDLLPRKPLRNTDAILAVMMLKRHYESVTQKPDGMNEDARLTEQQNYVLLTDTQTYKGSIESLFAIIGFGRTQSHVVPLYKRLNSFDLLPELSSSLAQETAEVGRLIAKMIAILNKLDFDRLFPGSPGLPRRRVAINALEASLGSVPSPGKPSEFAVACREWARKLKVTIFGSEGVSGLAAEYQQAFFIEARKDELCAGILDRVLQDVNDRPRWEGIVASPTHRSNIERWKEPGKIRLPRISSASSAKWSRDLCLCFDPLVREALADIFSNVIHSSREVENPWYPEHTAKADLWWRATEEAEAEAIKFELANGADDRIVLLKPRPSVAGLERIGGKVVSRPDPGRRFLFTDVWVPRASALVKGG